MSLTLTEYIDDRRAALHAEYPGEPVPAEQVDLWRLEWARQVREAANARQVLPMRVMRSYVRVFGREAVRDLRGAANADEMAVQAWALAPSMCDPHNDPSSMLEGGAA